MKRGLIILGILITLPLVAIVIFYFWGSAKTSPQNEELMTYEGVTNLESESPDETYTVITYNIGYLSGLTNNLAVDRSQQLFENNLNTALNALKPLKPDIIGLQEVDINSHRSFGVNQVTELAQGLNLGYGAIAINWNKNYVPFPYLPFSAHFKQMLSGQAILSRYAIASQKRIVLEKVAGKPFFYNAFYIDRLAQISKITIDNQPITIINVHLEAFDEPTRRKQTEFIKDILKQYLDQTPVFLIGDFNSSLEGSEETDPTIKLLLEHPKLQPAIPEASQTQADQFTFPSDEPIAKLDYIFYTPDSIEKVEAKVVSQVEQASDHLPVLMKWRFKK